MVTMPRQVGGLGRIGHWEVRDMGQRGLRDLSRLVSHSLGLRGIPSHYYETIERPVTGWGRMR